MCVLIDLVTSNIQSLLFGEAQQLKFIRPRTHLRENAATEFYSFP